MNTLLRFLASYNQLNAKLVTKIALNIDIEPEKIAQGIKSFPGVEGRMQIIKNKKRDLTVAIDFAHTPNALDKVLTALKKYMRKEKITADSKDSRGNKFNSLILY